AKPAIEHFLDLLATREKDRRSLGKLIEKKILPLLTLLESSIERSHFVSLIAKRTGIKEEVVWEDLKRVKKSDIGRKTALSSSGEDVRSTPADAVRDGFSSQYPISRREQIEERLTELRLWKKELPEDAEETEALDREEDELKNHLSSENLREELANLSVGLATAETLKDNEKVEELTQRIGALHKEIRALEERKNVL
ncbi:MAG: hypothetical protein Q7R67_00615, partial [bacterium]|nr:hypothetical protein [bacterium]